MADIAARPALDEALIEDLLNRAFAEDLGAEGDITGNAVIPVDATLSAVATAREDMTLAGLEIALAAFRRMDPDVKLSVYHKDGDALSAGSIIFSASGNARALLAAERTALNSLQHLSGIATLVARYVREIEGTQAKLLDTRKTIPGLRQLQKYAARAGGAVNHRMGLFDAIMIKDNHIAAAGSVSAAVEAAHRAGHDRVQVECDTLAQVEEAVSAGATSLLLDNMPPALLKEAVALVPNKVSTEASGGVTLETIRAIAETGVDFVSVGRLTQSAPAVDIGLDID